MVIQPKLAPKPPLPARFTPQFQKALKQKKQQEAQQQAFEEEQQNALIAQQQAEEAAQLSIEEQEKAFFVAQYGPKVGFEYFQLYKLEQQLAELKKFPGNDKKIKEKMMDIAEAKRSIGSAYVSTGSGTLFQEKGPGISTTITKKSGATINLFPSEYGQGVYVTLPTPGPDVAGLKQEQFFQNPQFISVKPSPVASYVLSGGLDAKYPTSPGLIQADEGSVVPIEKPIFYNVQEIGENILQFAQTLSEAPFIIGANTFRGISDIGRSTGKAIYDFTSPGQPGESLPLLGIITDQYGNPQIQFVPASQRPSTYNPYQSEKDFQLAKEQTAIVGGTLFQLAPYFVGGAVTKIQHVADIGSAFKESPEKAAGLVGVGIASTVLFNQLGAVKRLVKGQLGGTIAGSIGFSKKFEDVTQIGGKIAGIGLLVPYALQELPPLASSFVGGNVEGFRQSVTSIQRVRGPLFLGSSIGQKLSTGFTLFPGTTKAITTGGLNAPTETLARKRLIANVFNANPGDIAKIGGKTVDIYATRKLYESYGFTKQKFLESYGTIFGELNTARIPIQEYKVGNVAAVSKSPKAQKITEQYFREKAGEFAVFGSTTQQGQLTNKPGRLYGDVDILAKDPKSFAIGLEKRFTEAGLTDFKLIGSGKEFSIIRNLPQGGTEKFISAHQFKGNELFPTLETVAGIIPKRVFGQTSSGVVVENLSFQAKAKVIGGFVDARKGGLDIGDVLTITQGVKSYLPSNQGLTVSQGFNINSSFGKLFSFTKTGYPTTNQLVLKPLDKFELNLRGKIEVGTGIFLPGERLKNIAVIGTESNPIKNISIITGEKPATLVKKFGELKVGGLTSQQAKAEPDLIAAFGFEEKTRQPGIAFRSFFQGIPQEYKQSFQQQGVLAHELTHAGEYVSGFRLEKTAGLSNIDYTFSDAEGRARGVQQAFLESRGTSLPFGELIFTKISDIKPLIKTESIAPVKDYSSLFNQFFKPVSGVGVVKGVSDYSAYYARAQQTSVLPYFPTRKQESYYSIPVVRENPVYYPTPAPQQPFTPPPYVPPPTTKTPPYVPPPYNPPTIIIPPDPPPPPPPYVPPPTTKTPPYVPPPVIGPPVIPPPTTYTPPGTPIPPRGPPTGLPSKRDLSKPQRDSFSQAFKLITKVKGKEVDVPILYTYRDVHAAGSNLLANTLRASYKVKPVPGVARSRGIAPASIETYRSKSGFIVQKRGTRLSSLGEIREIRVARLKKSKDSVRFGFALKGSKKKNKGLFYAL